MWVYRASPLDRTILLFLFLSSSFPLFPERHAHKNPNYVKIVCCLIFVYMVQHRNEDACDFVRAG